MIKLITNKTKCADNSTDKIQIQSKLLRKNSSGTYYDATDSTNVYQISSTEDLVFVKLTFNEMNNEKLSALKMFLYFIQRAHTIVKAYSINGTNLSNAVSLANQASTFANVDDFIEYAGIESEDSNKYIDLSSVINNLQTTTTVMFALRFVLDGSSVTIATPEYVSSQNVEFIVAEVSSISGVNNLYEYNDSDFGKNGNVKVNLFNGEPNYSINLFSTTSKHMPINFAIFHNPNKVNSFNHMGFNLTPSFYYQVEVSDKKIIIEDPTGNKQEFVKLNFSSNDEKAAKLEEYGIKPLSIYNEIYYSHLDATPLFTTGVKTNDRLVVRTKNGNTITFGKNTPNQVFRIEKIEDSLGYVMTFVWNGDYINKIRNSEGEEILFSYTSSKITKVQIPAIFKSYSITYFSSDVLIQERDYTLTTSNAEVNTNVEVTRLVFDGTKLIKVEDYDTKYHLSISYENGTNVVSDITMFNADESQKGYKTTFAYNTKYTMLSDLEFNTLYYYFDTYGRVRTIMDKDNRTVTFNYDQFENGESKQLIGMSKVQVNTPSNLDNHSFERDIILPSSGESWYKTSITSAVIVDGGVDGGKCLRINGSSTTNAEVKQKVHVPNGGTYTLTGFIRHGVLSESDLSKIKVGFVGLYRTQFNDQMVPLTLTSKSVNSFAKLKDNNGNWYQFNVTTTIPTSAIISYLYVDIKVEGLDETIFIDDLQLNSPIPIKRNNLLENGFMEILTNSSPYAWNFENTSSTDKLTTISTLDEHTRILGNNVYKFSQCMQSNTLNSDLPVKKIYQTVDLNGVAGDEFIFSVFGKANVNHRCIFRAFVKTTFKDNTFKEYFFDFERNFNNWQMLTRSIIAENNYKSITVGVEYNGGVECLLDCFQLYRDNYGTYYNYDNRNNIVGVISEDGKSSRINYDDDNKVSEFISSDGSFYKYSYDDKGRLTKVTDLYGNSVELTYNEKSDIIKQKITTASGEVIENITTYDYTNNKETHTNEFGKTFEMTKDRYGRVTHQKFANTYDDIFTYNSKSQLLGYKRNTLQNSLSYDSLDNLFSMLSPNGSKYQMQYDTFGNLTKVTLDGDVLQTNTYSSTNSNGYSKGLLMSTQYGSNGDSYNFEYDSKGQVTKIKINNTVIAENTYDDEGNLIRVIDSQNNKVYHYSYDLNRKLVTKLDESGNIVKYSYDNLDNIQKVVCKINDSKYSVDYQHQYETFEYTKEGFLNRLSNAYGDEMVVGGRMTFDKYGVGQFGLKPIRSDINVVYDNELKMDVLRYYAKGAMTIYDLSTCNIYRKSGLISNNRLTYERWKSEFENNKSIYMWIKPSGTYSEQNIIEFQPVRNATCAYLKTTAEGKLQFASMLSSSITTVNKLKLNEWNLIGIQMLNAGNNTANCKLILNGEVTQGATQSLNVSSIKYLALMSNYGNGALPLGMPVNIAFIGIGAYNYTDNDFKAIYLQANKYMIAQPLPKSTATIYYDGSVYEGMDVISLNGSFESLSGVRPYSICNIDSSFGLDKARMLKYDEYLNRHVFGSYDSGYNLTPGNNSKLSYKLDLSLNATICLRYKLTDTQTVNGNRPLFCFVKNNTNMLGVFVNNERYVCLVVNGVPHHTGIRIPINNWNNIAVVCKSNTINLYLDGSPAYTASTAANLISTLTYIGSNPLDDTVANGDFEMFAYSGFTLESNISNICMNGAPTVVKNNIDSIGRIESTEINTKNNTTAFSVNYEYNKTRVEKETDTNGDIIEYEYDNVGRLIKKKYLNETNPSNISTETCGYDVMGRLSWENCTDDLCRSYTYDNNGNILTWLRGDADRNYDIDKTFTYDPQIKDRLMSVIDREGDNMEFSYDASNPYLPIGMIYGQAEFELTWQGKRLVEVNRTNGNEIYLYEYYSNGLRKSKVLDNINYYYDGTKLIQMVKGVGNNQYVLDFIYDANDLLIGVNTSEGQYFYRRDITGNILGIFDSNGNYVVKYRYDAWGNVLDKQVLVNCIVANHNPFLYKGYVYDEETKWYYLQSRYYIPEIGRFLSPDFFDFIDTETISGLNLFVYCGNNPIDGFDPEGTWNWKKFLLVAVIAIVVTAAVVVSGGSALLVAGVAATGAVAAYAAGEETAMVVDLSLNVPIGNLKVGFSFVIDFESMTTECYAHIGQSYSGGGSGLSGSYSVGIIDNYTGSGSYGGLFVNGGANCRIGIDHCFDPRYPYDTTVKATSITFSTSPSPSAYIGYDWYFKVF